MSLTSINRTDLGRGNPRVDFGQGFYVTSIFKQVLSFARYRTNFINRYKDKFGEKPDRPIIIKYQLDAEQLSKLRGKIFEKPGIRRAEFVYNNRVREKNT